MGDMTKQEALALGFGYVVLFSAIYLVTQCPESGCFSRGAAQPSTFQDCIAAGNPVMESYPRQCRLPDGTVLTEDTAPVQAPRAEITLLEPVAGSSVGLPLELNGHVRGETGDVHYQLLDVDGTVLAEGIAVQGEQEGETYTFSGVATYQDPFGQSGAVLLSLVDPASGDVITEMRVEVGFRNDATEDVQVFFLDTAADPDREQCDTVRAFTRRVGADEDGVRGALRELLVGPTDPERRLGAQTAIPDGVRVLKSTLIAGTLRVDFSAELLQDVQDDCRMLGIRTSLDRTLRQFPEVKRVEITVNGRRASELTAE